ncbi:aminopeptidase P family protein [Legionella israelensis]|uniref:M24 family metallopeptidase n=1 Tax=Legionella israelensis TaxID=454 RepID=UPI00118117ED|nr:Xaa-Pro peptidase family protein [Legionella israelensis]QDP72936.1 aminopeptidase P family protein [Legionella israelensis]
MRFFSDKEFENRLTKARQAIESKGFDACIITNPENIYYLTGLNHQGYFAYTSLILPVNQEPVLIMRRMEEKIVKDMVIPSVRFFPYNDGIDPLPKASNTGEDLTLSAYKEGAESGGLMPSSMSLGISVRDEDEKDMDYTNPAKVTCKALKELRLESSRVAFEKNSSFLPYRIAEGFVQDMPNITWFDAENLINDCRAVLSAQEIECAKVAGKISDAMILSGIAMAGENVPNKNVAAQVFSAMVQRGGTYPAFVPLIRSTRTLNHEHGTWDDDVLQYGDHLFLEMSGCHWRYHAPVGRLIHIGKASSGAEKATKVCVEAEYNVVDTIKPGVTANEVYQVWKKTIDKYGFEHYHRHHCGYMVGIGFPPSWSGSGVPRSLRNGSDMIIKEGMVFHLLSWLMRTGKGDAFVSDSVVVTKNGCEFLTNAPRELMIR